MIIIVIMIIICVAVKYIYLKLFVRVCTPPCCFLVIIRVICRTVGVHRRGENQQTSSPGSDATGRSCGPGLRLHVGGVLGRRTGR
jgi:hypothetical protein